MAVIEYPGNKAVNTLYEYNIVSGVPTGRLKPNTPSDPDYIAPELNSPTCGKRVMYSNREFSQRFTRNNCSPGLSGTSITYIVPAGKYLGTTQQAADSLAQLDLFVNGQTYANTHATCVLN